MTNIYYEFNTIHNRWEEKNKILLKDFEKEILELAAKGLTTEEISRATHKAKDTVKSCKAKLFRRLGTSNTIEAFAKATYLSML